MPCSGNSQQAFCVLKRLKLLSKRVSMLQKPCHAAMSWGIPFDRERWNVEKLKVEQTVWQFSYNEVPQQAADVTVTSQVYHTRRKNKADSSDWFRTHISPSALDLFVFLLFQQDKYLSDLEELFCQVDEKRKVSDDDDDCTSLEGDVKNLCVDAADRERINDNNDVYLC